MLGPPEAKVFADRRNSHQGRKKPREVRQGIATQIQAAFPPGKDAQGFQVQRRKMPIRRHWFRIGEAQRTFSLTRFQ